ncbi:MAG: DUF1192 domain-containing protein [Brevundimonas sp.]|jgi:uncharacterized small protein (DUF1192 family)|uniref:DUF1192 domain-containing protein n=1 Tax=Brevundimonas sp. TaxID=1871086 RepID=UPI0022C42B17|nr:DUF1192 domain-containing protein [Brevundimonas sp.]
MSFEELEPRPAREAVTALTREDLDPYAVADLEVRIATLEAEIARTRQAIATKSAKRSAADAFFNLGG